MAARWREGEERRASGNSSSLLPSSCHHFFVFPQFPDRESPKTLRGTPLVLIAPILPLPPPIRKPHINTQRWWAVSRYYHTSSQWGSRAETLRGWHILPFLEVMCWHCMTSLLQLTRFQGGVACHCICSFRNRVFRPHPSRTQTIRIFPNTKRTTNRGWKFRLTLAGKQFTQS